MTLSWKAARGGYPSRRDTLSRDDPPVGRRQLLRRPSNALSTAYRPLEVVEEVQVQELQDQRHAPRDDRQGYSAGVHRVLHHRGQVAVAAVIREEPVAAERRTDERDALAMTSMSEMASE